MRKICVFTGTRAEYGILRPLLSEIQGSESLQLQLIVSGTHLAREFSLTYRDIERDGFIINKKVEMLLSSDTPLAISKSMGLGLMFYAEALLELTPDLLVILGDRYEAMSMALAATVNHVPIVHIHGGETTEGAYDEGFRHAITKLSHIHFASCDVYRNRIIQLGENPKRVFNTGALSVDNMKDILYLSLQELEADLNINIGKRELILFTYHPVTHESFNADEQIQTILKTLEQRQDFYILFTGANADTNGSIINEHIKEFVRKNQENSSFHLNLGVQRYLSAMKYCTFVMGNSSSAIGEAPFFNIPTLNIGDRQKGRLRMPSIFDVPCEENKINDGIKFVLSSDFRERINGQKYIYGRGNTAKQMVRLISTIPIPDLLQKKFYDITLPLTF